MPILDCVIYLTPKRREPFQMYGEAERGMVHRELLFGVDHLLTAFALVFICPTEVVDLHEFGEGLFHGIDALYVKTKVKDCVKGI